MLCPRRADIHKWKSNYHRIPEGEEEKKNFRRLTMGDIPETKEKIVTEEELQVEEEEKKTKELEKKKENAKKKKELEKKKKKKKRKQEKKKGLGCFLLSGQTQTMNGVEMDKKTCFDLGKSPHFSALVESEWRSTKF